jgi:hypothetical protein
VGSLLALLVAAQPAVAIEVFVPLCDSALIACGPGHAGDPESLTDNLYWGAAYGAERFLAKAPGFEVSKRTDRPYPDRPHILREVLLRRRPGPREREVTIRLLAYSGRSIDQALVDFLGAAAGQTQADVVVWAGHDRLMDVAPPDVTRSEVAKPVVVLACVSQQFFGPVLEKIGASPLALTRSFMAPEAYLLEAVAAAVASSGVAAPERVREALVAAYAKYQRISLKAASTVFAVSPPRRYSAK